MENSGTNERIRKTEMFISALGSAVCLLITYLIWRSVITNQGIWLLPGIYFIELVAGAVLCSLTYFLRVPLASTASWIYSGILAVFIVLAGFTVGFLYIPVFLIFAGLSIFSVIQHRQNIFKKLRIFIVAGLIQIAVMLVFVWVSMQ